MHWIEKPINDLASENEKLREKNKGLRSEKKRLSGENKALKETMRGLQRMLPEEREPGRRIAIPR